jgi:putative NADPH-quinone reductase
MSRRILVIQGHPDPASGRLCRALADAYASAAEAAGHELRRIDVASLDFPLLRTKQDFDKEPPAPAIRAAQESIAWAEHVVILYPLWLGAMPALLKGFLEQVFRPGFAFAGATDKGQWTRKLKGRSARIIVTMGMPALIYRWVFGAHSLKSLERNILRFAGFGPVKDTLIGRVEGASEARRRRWLDSMQRLGRAGR